jgi:hypothetical protein
MKTLESATFANVSMLPILGGEKTLIKSVADSGLSAKRKDLIARNRAPGWGKPRGREKWRK